MPTAAPFTAATRRRVGREHRPDERRDRRVRARELGERRLHPRIAPRLGHVVTRAEALARAGEHDAADGRVGVGLREAVDELLLHLEGRGVPGVGPVQGDRGHPVGDVEQDRGQFHQHLLAGPSEP